jgi:DNA-binding response OmpR family regulator
VLLEALDLVGAGRSALARLRAVPALREVPVLLAVTVNALERLSVDIHGRRVRMKLGTLDPIETVRGVGYKVCS